MPNYNPEPSKNRIEGKKSKLTLQEVYTLRKCNKKDLVALIEELYHALFRILEAKDMYDVYPPVLWELLWRIDLAKYLSDDIDLMDLPNTFKTYRKKMGKIYHKHFVRQQRQLAKQEAEDEELEKTDYQKYIDRENTYYNKRNSRNW